jgi:hypothetical protein
VLFGQYLLTIRWYLHLLVLLVLWVLFGHMSNHDMGEGRLCIRKITLALRVLRVSIVCQSVSECLRVNWSVLKTITSFGINKRPIGLKHIY